MIRKINLKDALTQNVDYYGSKLKDVMVQLPVVPVLHKRKIYQKEVIAYIILKGLVQFSKLKKNRLKKYKLKKNKFKMNKLKKKKKILSRHLIF